MPGGTRSPQLANSRAQAGCKEGQGQRARPGHQAGPPALQGLGGAFPRPLEPAPPGCERTPDLGLPHLGGRQGPCLWPPPSLSPQPLCEPVQVSEQGGAVHFSGGRGRNCEGLMPGAPAPGPQATDQPGQKRRPNAGNRKSGSPSRPASQSPQERRGTNGALSCSAPGGGFSYLEPTRGRKARGGPCLRVPLLPPSPATHLLPTPTGPLAQDPSPVAAKAPSQGPTPREQVWGQCSRDPRT